MFRESQAKVSRDASRLWKVTMERHRPTGELKNSKDVQDAHIEDYFRYDDLSRMEAEAISIKIA